MNYDQDNQEDAPDEGAARLLAEKNAVPANAIDGPKKKKGFICSDGGHD